MQKQKKKPTTKELLVQLELPFLDVENLIANTISYNYPLLPDRLKDYGASGENTNQSYERVWPSKWKETELQFIQL